MREDETRKVLYNQTELRVDCIGCSRSGEVCVCVCVCAAAAEGGLYWLQQKWGGVCVCVCAAAEVGRLCVCVCVCVCVCAAAAEVGRCVCVLGRPEPSFSRRNGRHWEALSSVPFIQICIGHPLVPTTAQTLDVPWQM